MDTPWRIELLGWLRATRDGRIITRFRTRKTGEMLAYLAFYQHRSHAREALIELLWPERDPETGHARLRWALTKLRRQLEPPDVAPGAVVLAGGGTLQLSPVACFTDVAGFEASLRAADHTGSSSERVRRLTEAVELYRGELLPGCYEEWVPPERARLAEAYLQALEQLTDLLEQSGDLSHALQWARRAVSADPLREEAHHAVIRLLAAAGQPAAALRQYREFEKLLSEELGATPAPELRSLARDIERHAGQPAATSPGGPVSAPSAPLTAGTPAPSALPSGTVAFLLIETPAALTQGGSAADETAAGQAFRREQLGSLLREHRGHPLSTGGDTLRVLFAQASGALAAAVAALRAAAESTGPRTAGATGSTSDPVPGAMLSEPRMALHLGELAPGEDLHHNPAFQHATRLLLAAHPGQILLTGSAAALVQADREMDPDLVDLGRYRLHDGGPPECLYQVNLPEGPQREFPPPNALRAHEGHLPLLLTRFFGREEEIARLCEAVGRPCSSLGEGRTSRTDGRQRTADNPKLITLTGPGGSGKTRLAVEAARQFRAAYAGAVWFVPLLDITDPRLIVDKAAEVLRLPRSPQMEPLEQVVALLSRQPSVLLLDNFEHLVSEGASTVRALLERVPSLTCLVTSRARLGLLGEREFPVAPLPTPIDGPRLWADEPTKVGLSDLSTVNHQPSTLTQCPSVQLFVDRAQRARPDFQLTPRNAVVVAALCQRLDGIPLALELAAARAQALTPAQMLAQLERHFEFLVSRQRDPDPRHQSLWTTIDWSYRLLPPELQQFFTRLSVFRGGCTPVAAAAVCEGGSGPERSLDYLEALRRSSLVIDDEGGEEMRFRLLETIREYAAERLTSGERPALLRRHANYYLMLAEEAEPHLSGPKQAAWLNCLQQEHDNFRAVLDWSSRTSSDLEQRAVGCDAEEAEPTAGLLPVTVGLRIATALVEFWGVKGLSADGRRWLKGLLEQAGTHRGTSLGVRALCAAAALAYDQCDYEEAGLLAQKALQEARELGDQRHVAWSLNILGRVGHAHGDYAAARSSCEESLAIYRELGDPHGMTGALEALGLIAQGQGDLPLARVIYEEALEGLRQRGDDRRVAASLYFLGDLARRRGELEVAQSLLEESLGTWRKLDGRHGVAAALGRLGLIAHRRGDYQTARAVLTESLMIRREMGEKYGVADCLHNLGHVAAAQGEMASARSLFEECLVGYRGMGYKEGIVGALGSLGDLACDVGDLATAESSFEEAMRIAQETGSRWSLAETLRRSGRLARRQRKLAAARSHLRAGVVLFLEMEHALGLMSCLQELARIAGEMGETERAVRLFGAVAALRNAIGVPLSAFEQAALDRQLGAVRAALTESAFAGTWAEGEAMTREEAVAEALS